MSTPIAPGLNDPCPRCGVEGSGVINSRPHLLGRVRRRLCNECGYRWTTLETAVIEQLEATNIRLALADAMRAMNNAWTALETAAAIWGQTPVQEGIGPIVPAGSGDVSLVDADE